MPRRRWMCCTACRWPAGVAPTVCSRWCWRTGEPEPGGRSQPSTEWLGEDVARDRWGFILTGPDLATGADQSTGVDGRTGGGPFTGPGKDWRAGRPPLVHETSLPGVFAAGDVRRGSVKRVASAVGDGAVTTPVVHRYLENAAVPANAAR